MKLILPSALLALCLLGASVVQGAYLHKNVSLVTYTDFGQNCGRYVSGTTNALLAAIRQAEGGIRITYTDDLAGAAVNLPLAWGMIDFGSLSDTGSVTAVGGNYFVSAYHLYENTSLRGVYNPTFSGDRIGSANAIHYAYVQLETPLMTNGEHTDYCLSRMSKVVTDVQTYAPYTDGTLAGSGGRELLFRSGSGESFVKGADGGETILLKGVSDMNATYAVGGINSVDMTGNFGHIYDNYPDSVLPMYAVTDWRTEGISLSTPLPIAGAFLDSGSGYWGYNVTNNRYEYIGPLSRAGTLTDQEQVTYGFSALLFAGNRAADAMAAHNAVVQAEDGAMLQISAVDKSTVGRVTGSGQVTEFKGVYGKNTWKKLNTEMNKAAWYAYSDSYLNGFGGDGDLSYLADTSNLVITAKGSAATVELEASVDLGIGYAQFSKTGSTADFTVKAADGTQAQFNHAGYMIDAGVNVHVQLTNSADYAREWRKVGEGNLYIEGSGDNYIGLNLGGSGTTYLNRTGGYAAYNVLANTGATVVLQDVKQIARDFTFGNGGGVLDFNGNSMVWNNSAAVADDGFTIHALTEEAVIANNGSGVSTLTIQNAGSTFLGSFRDSATGALQVVYAGDGTLNWHGIVTNLSHHADSGITVQSGTLSLSGTNTVHGQGSEDGKTTARYTHAADWHYADAAANVTVQNGGSFELGSHARLIGNVTVEEGGTFVMHEGVLHEQEYLEGGQMLQSTAAIAAFYGLKGKVDLAQGAVMRADICSAATVATEYGYTISGSGSLIKTGEGTLRLTGANTYSGGTTVQEGTLVAESSAMLGSGSVTVQGGTLAMGQVSLRSADGTQGVELSGFRWLADGSRTELRAESETELAHALLDLEEGTLLQLTNVVLASDTRITDAPAAVELNHVRALAELGENAHVTARTTLAEGTQLTLCGGSGETLTTESPATLTELRLDTLSDVDIRGTAWSITLSDWENSLVAHTDWVAITLGLEGQEATLSSAVTVTLTLAGRPESLQGYVLPDSASTVYFNVATAVPEPSTVAFFLPALAALAARRKKR